MQILHAHSSSLSSLPRCYFMYEFSVNHMRTTNAHNSLSAQSDQPLCCLLLKNCFCQFWFSGRCEGICLKLCIPGIFNRNIWDANSTGSSQTCDFQSHQDLLNCLTKKLNHKFTIYLKFIAINTGPEMSCFEVSGSTLLLGLFGIIYACLLQYLQSLNNTKLFAQSALLPMK